MNLVQVTHKKGKPRQELTIGRHQLVADVSSDLGGEDAQVVVTYENQAT